METFDPIYQAVRSKISHCDIESVIQQAISNANLEWHVSQCRSTIESVAYEYQRPCVLFRVEPNNLFDEVKQCRYWSARYGDVIGVGQSASGAMYDFDRKWLAKSP